MTKFEPTEMFIIDNINTFLIDEQDLMDVIAADVDNEYANIRNVLSMGQLIKEVGHTPVYIFDKSKGTLSSRAIVTTQDYEPKGTVH